MPNLQRPDAPPDRRGFSLIELMCVVTLIGLMLGFGIPAFRHYRQSAALPGESGGLVSALRLARQIAVSRSTSCGVRVDPTGGRYQIFDPANDTTTVWRSMASGVRFLSVQPPVVGQNTFVFDYCGRLVAGGRLVLANAIGDMDTVEVSLSGRVSNP